MKLRIGLILTALTLLLTACPSTPAPNVAPTAADDAYQVAPGGTLIVSIEDGVLANDTDADNDALTAVVVGDPQNGTLELGNKGAFKYIHDGSATTSDTFTYKANDGKADSNIATVTITITEATDSVVANDDAYTVNLGSTLTVDAATGVLTNDVGTALTISDNTDPAEGTLTLNTDGAFSYVPNATTTATSDTFTYTATDGTNSDTATVTISLEPATGTLVATDDSYTTVAGATLYAGGTPAAAGITSASVIANDTTSGAGVSVDFPTDVDGLTGNVDGSFSYAPPAGTTGDVTFTYSVADDSGVAAEEATVTITVLPGVLATDTASVNGAAADDVILLPTGTYGTLNLKSGQVLIGEGSSADVDGTTLVFGEAGATKPVIASATGVGIELADSVTVKGVSVSSSVLSAIRGLDVLTGTITIEDVDVTGGVNYGIGIEESPKTAATAPLGTVPDTGGVHTLVIRNVTVAGITGAGAAILSNDAANVTIDGANVSGLSADLRGIQVESEYDITALLANNTVDGGTAVDTEGIYIFKNNSFSNRANTTTMTVTLSDNTVTMRAGAGAGTRAYSISVLGEFTEAGPPAVTFPADTGTIAVSGTGNTGTSTAPVAFIAQNDSTCTSTLEVGGSVIPCTP